MRDRSRICSHFALRALQELHNVVLHCARGGARPRPQRELRAVERLLAPSRARTRVEGEGRGAGEPRPAAPVVHLDVHPTERDPACDIRARASRRHEADLAPRALRARRVALRLLRNRGKPAHTRPRRPEIARRDIRLGKRRHLLRTVQPPQGRSAARRDEHDATHSATAAHAGPVHTARDRPRAGYVASVPARNRSRGRGLATWPSHGRPLPAPRARGRRPSVPGRDP